MENTLLPSSMRERIVDRIEKRIEGIQKGYRQNVAIVSPEGLGKSLLLSSLFESLVGRPPLVPVFIRPFALNFDHFVECWIGSLVNAIFLSQNVTPPEEFSALLDAAEAIVPKTSEKIKSIKKLIRHEKNAASIKEMFSLPTVVAEETGKNVILIIDEFQNLEKLPASDPFALLGKEIMISKNTLYVVAGSNSQKVRDIFHDKLSLLFGNFEMIEMMPLSFQETGAFLKKRLPKRIFTSEQIKFLIRMTNGNPTYLDLLINQIEILLYHNFMPEISNDVLFEAFHRELYDHHGRIALIFENRLNICARLAKDSAPYIMSLLAISEGRRKVPNIAAYVQKKVGESSKVLQRLIQEELIVKRGAFYVIEDPMFRFWLRTVYKKRQSYDTCCENKRKSQLKQPLEETFLQMDKEDRELLTTRVENLFREFRNDVVEVNGKKLRCPNFNELIFRPSHNRMVPLYAKGPKVRWLCQVAKERVSEEDVTIFLEESKIMRKNVQKKIIITLAGIDQNAKLMAQEAKIHLWDLRSFNSLLDLYDLPKLIIIENIRQEQNATALGALA